MNNSTLNETRRKGNKTLIALFVIAVAVYLGFTPLFELIPDGVPRAVIGSSFGAIFVIILTMYLLNKQTEIEQESKRGERVFDEKVKLYQSILKVCREIVEDGVISSSEVKKLPFSMVHLQMVGGDDAVQSFSKVVAKLNQVFNSDKKSDEVVLEGRDESEIYKLVSDFSIQCRIDLGISDKEIDGELIKLVQNVMNESNELSKRDTKKISYNGKEYPKNRLVLEVFKNFIKTHPEVSFDQLENEFPPLQGSRPLFVKLEEALEIKEKSQARHFVKEEDVLQLGDQKIAVSNQWGSGNLPRFLEHCRTKHGIEIG